jgi:homoserine kinase
VRFNVRVPASSANLGSGFDTLAVALNLFTELEVESGGSGIQIDGGPDLVGGDNLVLQGLQLAADTAERSLPSCRIRVSSNIPVARGLGSSATALVCGLVAGNQLLDQPLSEHRLFELAAKVEGHGDNVSASLFGGVTLSVMSDRGVVVRRIPVNGELRVVVFIPDALAFTADARAVVPVAIPRSDAVRNVGRCALLVLALVQGDFSAFGEAMRDALHQPYRSALFPHVEPMIAGSIEAGAFGACLSGAGPSVLSFVDPERAAGVVTALGRIASDLGVPGNARLLDIEYEGATVLQPVAQREHGFS